MVLDDGMLIAAAMNVSGNLIAGIVPSENNYDLGASAQSVNDLALLATCTTSLVKNAGHGGIEVASLMVVGSATIGGVPIVVGQSRPFGNLLLDAGSLPVAGENMVIPLHAPLQINNTIWGIRYISAVWVNTHVAQNPGSSVNYFTSGVFRLRLVDASTLSKNRNYPRAF